MCQEEHFRDKNQAPSEGGNQVLLFKIKLILISPCSFGASLEALYIFMSDLLSISNSEIPNYDL